MSLDSTNRNIAYLKQQLQWWKTTHQYDENCTFVLDLV